jgi:hypothetical protein
MLGLVLVDVATLVLKQFRIHGRQTTTISPHSRASWPSFISIPDSVLRPSFRDRACDAVAGMLLTLPRRAGSPFPWTKKKALPAKRLTHTVSVDFGLRSAYPFIPEAGVLRSRA